MKVQEKINMHKQLNRFENVVDEMKGLVIEKRNETNSIKDDDGEEDKEYDDDGKGMRKIMIMLMKWLPNAIIWASFTPS